MKCISLKEGMVKALKKNQIIIFAIALMLITAGYLNYSMNVEQTAETSAIAEQNEYASIGDAKLVSNNNVIEEASTPEQSSQETSNNEDLGKKSQTGDNNSKIVENKSQTNEDKPKTNEIESKETSSNSNQDLDTYFTESKLEREKMYSEMLESYQSILANQNIETEQKNTAQTEISNINKQKNAIMISENLIKNKGFKDVIIFVNNQSISVVIRSEKLEEADIAQIQSIIQRELSVNVENIHISNK